jgi:beta-xylosidase
MSMNRPDPGPAALPGFFADPNLSTADGVYWLHPTTDGLPGWGASSFRAFKSTDLREWEDCGVVFDLARDTGWVSEHAWAPGFLAEEGVAYLYYSGHSNIGVARGTSPAGPFTDLGRPLVADGQFDGGAIDPSVFRDRDGTVYLLWGNMWAHLVPLEADRMSFDPARVHSWQPTGFREAAWLHERNGIYYLSWSENDTREEDYRVRYATGPGPYGPWEDQGVLLEKEESRGVLATGHHSIVRVADTDDWVIAYHRFAIPGGSGTRREVVLDRLVHHADGALSVAPRTHFA